MAGLKNKKLVKSSEADRQKSNHNTLQMQERDDRHLAKSLEHPGEAFYRRVNCR